MTPNALRTGTVQATTAMLAILLLAAGLQGKNVDFSTVPNRDTVQLTIYNSEDLTLVRETRTVSFAKGNNALQFSWANTLIDPSSVDLRFVSRHDRLELLDTTFPHDRPQLLVWNVASDIDGEAQVEITYFTSGISWSADYLCIADAAERTMSIESRVRITNNSGELYENARVRLVVGQINLVEKIAQLASVSLGKARDFKRSRGRTYYLGAKFAMDRPTGGFGGGYGDAGATADDSLTRKQVIKEGLSEYFIYTIEGTETVPNGTAKQLRSFKQLAVPFRIEYRYRVPEYGDQLVRMYLLRNDKAASLGETPLPNGAVRLFRRNPQGGLSYLATQAIKYVPIGDKIELNLGVDPHVVFQWVKLRSWRTHIWLQLTGVRALRRVDDGTMKMETTGQVAGWDEHGYYAQRIRNTSDKTIDVEVRRVLTGHVVFRSGLNASKHDYRTVEFRKTIGARKTVDLRCEIVYHQGRNKKQDNLKLVDVR